MYLLGVDTQTPVTASLPTLGFPPESSVLSREIANLQKCLVGWDRRSSLEQEPVSAK